MEWNTNYIPELEREIGKRVQAAGYFVMTEARKLISVAGRTVSFTTIGKGKNKGKQKKVVGPMGSNPSKPGEPPHRQTGRLRASVAQEHEPAKLTSRVGTNVAYGKFLELGTAKMAARPWLRRTLANNRNKVREMILGE